MPSEQTQFKPGKTGNPGGRPKGIAAKAREHTDKALDVLVAAWKTPTVVFALRLPTQSLIVDMANLLQ